MRSSSSARIHTFFVNPKLHIPMFRPWLFVVGAFLVLIAAWTSLIFVAAKFSPKEIPVMVKPH